MELKTKTCGPGGLILTHTHSGRTGTLQTWNLTTLKTHLPRPLSDSVFESFKPANVTACHGEGFGEAIDRQGSFPHVLQGIKSQRTRRQNHQFRIPQVNWRLGDLNPLTSKPTNEGKLIRPKALKHIRPVQACPSKPRRKHAPNHHSLFRIKRLEIKMRCSSSPEVRTNSLVNLIGHHLSSDASLPTRVGCRPIV